MHERRDRDKLATSYFNLLEFAKKLERELNVSRAVNLDDCHTDTLCRESARPVLGDWVDGDNWGVPSTADIVDRLVNMVILSDNVEVLLHLPGSEASTVG
jgi:hypothetical protein